MPLTLDICKNCLREYTEILCYNCCNLHLFPSSLYKDPEPDTLCLDLILFIISNLRRYFGFKMFDQTSQTSGQMEPM